MNSIPIFLIHKIDPFLKLKSGIILQIIKIFKKFQKGNKPHNMLYHIDVLK